MAKVMKCDRCGKIYEPYEDEYEDEYEYNQVSLGNGAGDIDDYEALFVYDLCPECIEAVLDFISHYEKKSDKEKEKEKEPNIRLDILKAINERMCEMFNVNPILKDTIHSVIFPNDIIYEEDVFTYNYIFKYHGSIVLSLPFDYSHKDIVLMMKEKTL